jgi:hypothetical protein
MKFRYSFEKNALLLEARGIGFEEIILEINSGNILTIEPHHDQKIMYVRCLDQVYVVPYMMEQDGTIFLKTAFPSRKATKRFLRGGESGEI